MKKSANTAKILIPTITGFGFLILWELLVQLLNVHHWIIPAPSQILIDSIADAPQMAPHILATTTTALAGFGLSIGVSWIIAIAMDLMPRFKLAVYPFLVVSQTIPIIFIYPLFMIWFGFGIATRIIVVILVCFFPVVVAVYDGMVQTNTELLDLFRAMGAGRLKTLFMVKIPSSTPRFFSGLKIAATYSVMGAVIGEWLGAQNGMGVYMIRSYKTFATSRVFGAITVVITLSLILFQAVKLLEKKSLAWIHLSRTETRSESEK